jgi:hypothetical protein
VALFTIKPNRGTVAFFVLLTLGLIARFVWGRHEQFLAQRDGPPAHTTRRLLRCVLGRDAQRLLSPRPADNSPAPWAEKITARLRHTITVQAHWDAHWPARCAPLAERLATRLSGSGETAHAAQLAQTVRGSLAAAAGDRLRALELVESGTLGTQLAALALEVIALSAGAESGWDSDLRYEPTDLHPLRLARPPEPVALPADADYATLALPDLVLYQSALDRRLHVVTFDARGLVRADRAIGRGAPVRGSAREGAVLVANDAGDAVFLPGGEPSQLVPVPPPLLDGTERLGEWQVALTPGYLWLLSHDGDTLHLRTTPRSGEPRWSEVALPQAWAMQTVGGDLLAAQGDAVDVLALRRGVTDVGLERQRVTALPAGPVAPADTARRAVRRTTPPAPPEALPVRWSVFSPFHRTCAAGATRYFLVASEYDGLSVVSVTRDGATRAELRYSEMGALAGRYELTCNEQGALLFADFAGHPGTLVYFPAGATQPVMVAPPRFGYGVRVVGGALTASHGIVALVSNHATLRAYQWPHVGGAWRGGALVADLVRPAPNTPDEEHTLEVFAVASDRDQVAVLAWVRDGARHYVARLASRDGGATWGGAD